MIDEIQRLKGCLDVLEMSIRHWTRTWEIVPGLKGEEVSQEAVRALYASIRQAIEKKRGPIDPDKVLANLKVTGPFELPKPEPPSEDCPHCANEPGMQQVADNMHALGIDAIPHDLIPTRPNPAPTNLQEVTTQICPVCAYPTVVSGACYRCLNCGHTMGCS